MLCGTNNAYDEQVEFAYSKFVDMLYDRVIDFMNSIPFNISSVKVLVLVGRVFIREEIITSLFKKKFPDAQILLNTTGNSNISGLTQIVL